jgi:hypothetical protein
VTNGDRNGREGAPREGDIDLNFNVGASRPPGAGGRFYATFTSRKQTSLLEGDVLARRARVLRETVDCASVSPDGTRIANKRRVCAPGEVSGEQLSTRLVAEVRRAFADGGAVAR